MNESCRRVCWCVLAGTSACMNCASTYKSKSYNVNIVPLNVPYKPQELLQQESLKEITNELKRLNERIDEIVGK